MSQSDMTTAAAAAGQPIEAAVAVFMLHPETFGASIEAGYANPFAGYVAGRGGVLGEATGVTVASVFTVFEPGFICAMWEEGVAVRGAAGAAQVYWQQVADFARRHLPDAEGTDRIAAIGEKIIAATPPAGLPLYAGWRTMELAEDSAARALQVMFVLRELRGDVHFNALSLSPVAPIEAHLLNKGNEYATMFGWPEPFPDPSAKRERYQEVKSATDRRMGEIFGAAVSIAEAEELARLSAAVLTLLQSSAAT